MNALQTDEKKGSALATGVKFGILAGALYILMLLLRYLFFSDSPVFFTGAMLFSYVVILAIYVMAGLTRKKELGGYADVKELFQTIFIVILIAELAYGLFNYIYLNFIDPEFFNRYMETTREYLQRIGGDVERMDDQIEKLKEQNEIRASVSTTLLGIATWIIVDSIIGLLIALIIRKPKPKY